MSEQLKLIFSKNTIRNINIYRSAAENESIGDDGYNVKFTPTQKEALKNIFREHNVKASSFIRDAMDFYIGIFPYREKLSRHRDFLTDFLKRLS